jgi:hypothetical protein
MQHNSGDISKVLKDASIKKLLREDESNKTANRQVSVFDGRRIDLDPYKVLRWSL